MIEVTFGARVGVTVGQRKDGSRAVQWEDDSIDWFKADEFAALMEG